MSKQIAVAAPILARDGTEEERLRTSVAALCRHNLPVFLVDGGSGTAFVDSLKRLPGVTVEQARKDGPRLLTQVQQALAAAREAEPAYILYTEPDKEWFFENRLSDFLAEAEQATDAGVVVAARDAESFATFPQGQQLTETLLHRLCAETWGIDGDFTYGPLLIHPGVVPYVEAIAEDIGWGWRVYLMAVCHRLGRHIALHTADLPCPADQRGENEMRHRIYRMEQLAQNVKGLALGMKVPL